MQNQNSIVLLCNQYKNTKFLHFYIYFTDFLYYFVHRREKMELANNLKQARLAKNMSQEELAAFIGKSKNVISSWERGDNKPDEDVIFSLCDILNADTNYLLCWKGNNSFSISITEQSLIKKYRSLDGYGRKAINNLLDVEYKRCNTVIEEDMPAYITKPYYAVGASAGSGEYLFDDLDCTAISLPDTPLTNKADLVIAVRGHSMESTYYDGG